MDKPTIALVELTFAIIGKGCGNDADCIYDKLMRLQMDQKTLGFWVWDLISNKELYSDEFRKSLGFSGEDDFPNVPQSWQDAIEPKDLKIVITNFEKHVKTNGEAMYWQKVTYNKKNGGKIDLVCFGKLVSFKDDKPAVMVGIHLTPQGTYKTV